MAFQILGYLYISSSAKTETNSTSTTDETLYPRPRLPPISFPNASAYTVYSSTQNLPAILNDPRLLKRQTDFFTKAWGEDFIPQEVPPLTLLPKIPTIYFDEYLKKTEFVSNLIQSIVHWENIQPTSQTITGSSKGFMKGVLNLCQRFFKGKFEAN